MKRLLTSILLAVFILVPASAIEEKLTIQTFIVNNRVVDCVADNIGGYNYFKLRDVQRA